MDSERQRLIDQLRFDNEMQKLMTDMVEIGRSIVNGQPIPDNPSILARAYEMVKPTATTLVPRGALDDSE